LFNGYLSNILKINNLLYIFGSYNNLSAPDGKKYQIEENKSNSFFTTIDVDGNWQETKILPANFSYYPLKFVKINSDYFDFISLREVPVSNYLKSGNFVTTINPYYAIISAKGSLYFSY
jgi:hypothetical protein